MSVCLSVDAYSGITGYGVANERYHELREPGELGDFPETTAFERYTVKTHEKANMHNHAGLSLPDRPTPRTLEAQEVTTEGVYRLPHSLPVSDSPRVTSKRSRVNA